MFLDRLALRRSRHRAAAGPRRLLARPAGLLLHALVFVLVAHFLWKLMKGPKRSSYRLSSQMGDDANVLAPRPGARAIQGSMDPQDC